MSLAIDVEFVSEVLLADGWHRVEENSFTLDSYEYIWEGQPEKRLHGGGNSGVCATGFEFLESVDGGLDDRTLTKASGPLTAILAVRHNSRMG